MCWHCMGLRISLWGTDKLYLCLCTYIDDCIAIHISLVATAVDIAYSSYGRGNSQ